MQTEDEPFSSPPACLITVHALQQLTTLVQQQQTQNKAWDAGKGKALQLTT
jgi:hypothetical protein